MEPKSYQKLELKVFTGEDPISWLFRVEHYFVVNAIPEDKKIDDLEEKAINWFQWLEARCPFHGWRHFQGKMLKHFHLATGEWL